MDISDLKEYIINNDKAEYILEQLGMHNIRKRSGYYSASWPDGDNPNGLLVYDNLCILSNTRDLSSVSQVNDLFTVIQFVKNIDFFTSVEWTCHAIGIGMYDNFEKNIPESIRFVKQVFTSIEEENEEDELEIKPIDKSILKYYRTPTLNIPFKEDHISFQTQYEFDIGYDEESNRITIPVYSPYDSSLIGVKGRLLNYNYATGDTPKYIALQPYPKGKVLYGLNKTLQYITKEHTVYVTEAEKGVMQLWTAGYKNCVATGGYKITRTQADQLCRLGTKIILCFDQDVSVSDLQTCRELFPRSMSVYCLYDKKSLLGPKMAPTDDMSIFEKLKENVYEIPVKE